MKVLAIETSGPAGGIALLDGDRIRSEISLGPGMTHGRELAPAIARITGECSVALRDLDLIAVDIGPGSFTGLRVGLAAAKGLCLALGKPILGIVSLDAMAEAARGLGATLCPVIDAKWDRLYGAIYAPERVSEILAESPEELVKRVPPDAVVFGDALKRYGSLFGGRHTLGPEFAHPSPSIVARIAARDFAAGRRDEMASLVPIYVRPTEAELRAGVG